jgi:hypothetical protein
MVAVPISAAAELRRLGEFAAEVSWLAAERLHDLDLHRLVDDLHRDLNDLREDR